MCCDDNPSTLRQVTLRHQYAKQYVGKGKPRFQFQATKASVRPRRSSFVATRNRARASLFSMFREWLGALSPMTASSPGAP